MYPVWKEGRSAFKILTGKPTGKRPLGSPRREWEDNIRMGLKAIGINMRNLVDSVQDRDYRRALVNAALNLRVPKAIELLILCVFVCSLLSFSNKITIDTVKNT